MANICVEWVLVDGGALINLLFSRALNTMMIPQSKLNPSTLGQIKLSVTFREPDNYHTEILLLDVAEFDTS